MFTIEFCSCQGFILSASTPGEDLAVGGAGLPDHLDCGLVAGHAYTLLTVMQVSTGTRSALTSYAL